MALVNEKVITELKNDLHIEINEKYKKLWELEKISFLLQQEKTTFLSQKVLELEKKISSKDIMIEELNKEKSSKDIMIEELKKEKSSKDIMIEERKKNLE